ncbi:hypothetical protein [Psychrobacillus lasiicapitis]|uniref:Uncharacterized protein n=1 Tax=Psychrobacillus lasiicapitis TaxID=1636719 RepID=A0A544TAA4_9BACI|nr:hypothetical protein [Psychrobacillus lasiicapitis]TQR14390.1 hypothetical protein FG382_08000 [Psychrobacillus lasiicapitis]GGA31744.1 hypothetical protein GCM10011384_21610 [Psychrobacillus lasiicapitis]
MRLRQRDLKPYTVKGRIPKEDSDGTTYEDWEEEGHIIQANIQPAGGRLMAEMYGERLAYMLSAYVESGTDLKETDGVCVYVAPDQNPDYKVVASPPWSSHSVVSLEAIRP